VPIANHGGVSTRLKKVETTIRITPSRAKTIRIAQCSAGLDETPYADYKNENNLTITQALTKHAHVDLLADLIACGKASRVDKRVRFDDEHRTDRMDYHTTSPRRLGVCKA